MSGTSTPPVPPSAAPPSSTLPPPAPPGEGRSAVERLSGPGTRRAWAVLGIVLSVLLFVPAALWTATSIAPVREITDRLTYGAGVRHVLVDTGAGDVTVLPAAAPGAVEVERRREGVLRMPRVTAAREGDVVRLRGTCGVWSGWLTGGELRCRLEFVVRVPAGVSVEVLSGSGDVSVRDVGGDVRATTRSGSVSAAGVGGAVSLRTGSGRVEATDVRGPHARLRTGSGDVAARDLAVGEVTVRTGSGRIDVGLVTPPGKVEATTGSGDVTVTVPRGGAYDVVLDTGSGSTTAGVPVDSASPRTVRLTTGSGDVAVRHP